ncbi:vitamin B12 ABC transporter substrate-binding protein BtuF [Erwinia sorbitola]|uniref:Vitamin B12-binding protein n=1 Tax=Erwinia sorbitola TaxID=2681984 RepID=A0A6I6EL68_9GAMM|nr:vitamin B12 ABC transporter substrate-binding protein BtuF [Erwinia sorbitola]MTD27299.1 vitamin B12 ABC transporter substrate-binding protein BtuF [Erwinia sorbitola]QGU88845.1 vitamin B12 ABC transporter substrate-binding protein BtuF [Erwinia sorbitola]
MAKRLCSLILLWLACAATVQAAPRVVTLAPNLTELAFAAGITPVGVSAYSDYPPAAQQIEQVANWQGINSEKLLRLKPDVVIAWKGGAPQRQIDQLQALGITVVWLAPDSIAELISSLRRLAAFSPQPAQAEQAAAVLQQQFAELRQRYQHSTVKRVFLQFGLKPLFTASGNTLQNEVLQLCGGENIFADSRVPWPQVSREQVLLRHPAAIVTPGDSAHAMQIAAFWQPQLNIPVIAINDDWISRAGPRMILAAQKMCSALHSFGQP